MPEKMQNTAAHLHQKMQLRYADGLEHKHNKDHLKYQNCRSHPAQIQHAWNKDEELIGATGLIRETNLRKMRTRQTKNFH